MVRDDVLKRLYGLMNKVKSMDWISLMCQNDLLNRLVVKDELINTSEVITIDVNENISEGIVKIAIAEVIIGEVTCESGK